MADKREFIMYRKDNTNYSFIIEPVLNEAGRVHIACFKRDKENKRVNINSFFLKYQVFKVLLDKIEVSLRTNTSLNKKFIGGKDGKRMLHVNRNAGVKDVLFNFPITEEAKEKGGEKMLFAIKDSFDISELLNLRSTINNWELANINKLIKQGYDGFSSSSFNKDTE